MFERVRAELGRARKVSHWMWFVFPQVTGLGASEMSRRYAISGCDEARAYAAHPLLGLRLRECTTLVNAVEGGKSLRDIFGSPDDLKFRSCMTLFSRCSEDAQVFQDALDKYCSGAGDPLTLARL